LLVDNLLTDLVLQVSRESVEKSVHVVLGHFYTEFGGLSGVLEYSVCTLSVFLVSRNSRKSVNFF
jgi:hypothetical protein